MPTTYAHYRFGCDVLQQLPKQYRSVIEAHRHMFDFGVHGPDLLFYYKPLEKNPVNQKGYESHNRTGRDFFTEAMAVAREARHPESALSYLYGVLCHFALDRECHPYIGRKEKEQVSHSAIEASFDRFLMVRDGLDPVTHNCVAHLHPSKTSAAVIAPFYSPVTEQELFEAQKQMLFFLKALIAKGPKRAMLLAAMKVAGKPHLGDLFVPYTPNPKCVDSDLRIYHLYEGAVPLAVTLIEEFSAAMAGTGRLGHGFDHTFGET